MLREYQLGAVDQAEDGDLIVSPTGTGKTHMLTELAAREAERGGLAMLVAHRHELLGQASNKFRTEGWLTPELNVLVRSIQELRNQPPIDRVTLLLWDEAHHCMSDDWSCLRTEQYPRARLIGTTATPERGDGRGLHLFKRIVTTISVREAIAQGYLVQPTVLRPAHALGPGELAQDPVDAYLEHARGTKAIAFFPTVQLAVEAACRFRDHVPAAAIWGDMPASDRTTTLQRFARGELLVLTSVNVLTEGFDVPQTETCILARGFGTAGGYLQAVGRVLRPAPDKHRALVLDLRGASHEHGDPDDDRTFHLSGKGIRRPGDDVDVRFCPVCGSPTVSTECEQCGHSGEMRLRKPRILGLPIDRFARVRADDGDAQARRLAKWLGECRAKGWKEGRALHRFKGAYGEWPASSVVTRARALTS